MTTYPTPSCPHRGGRAFECIFCLSAEAFALRARVDELEVVMKAIRHSMTMALVPGNDRMREINMTLRTVSELLKERK